MSHDNTIIRPVYYRIIERRGNGWAFKHGTPFINLFNVPLLGDDDLYHVRLITHNVETVLTRSLR